MGKIIFTVTIWRNPVTLSLFPGVTDNQYQISTHKQLPFHSDCHLSLSVVWGVCLQNEEATPTQPLWAWARPVVTSLISPCFPEDLKLKSNSGLPQSSSCRRERTKLWSQITLQIDPPVRSATSATDSYQQSANFVVINYQHELSDLNMQCRSYCLAF